MTIPKQKAKKTNKRKITYKESVQMSVLNTLLMSNKRIFQLNTEKVTTEQTVP